jgi:hypothetical protein
MKAAAAWPAVEHVAIAADGSCRFRELHRRRKIACNLDRDAAVDRLEQVAGQGFGAAPVAFVDVARSQRAYRHDGHDRQNRRADHEKPPPAATPGRCNQVAWVGHGHGESVTNRHYRCNTR